MTPVCVLTIVVLIAVVVIWALFRKPKAPTPEVHVAPEETRKAEPVIETPAPSPKSRKTAKPDDLTRLDGIGPKVNQVLKKARITTFAQLASADITKLKGALDAAGYRFMDPTGWIEQARLASEGKFDELKELQSRLKGGRKIG